jgi:hypothetical protein
MKHVLYVTYLHSAVTGLLCQPGLHINLVSSATERWEYSCVVLYTLTFYFPSPRLPVNSWPIYLLLRLTGTATACRATFCCDGSSRGFWLRACTVVAANSARCKCRCIGGRAPLGQHHKLKTSAQPGYLNCTPPSVTGFNHAWRHYTALPWDQLWLEVLLYLCRPLVYVTATRCVCTCRINPSNGLGPRPAGSLLLCPCVSTRHLN